jgi:hypothetical protein
MVVLISQQRRELQMIEFHGLAAAAAYAVTFGLVAALVLYLLETRRQKRLTTTAQNLKLTANDGVLTRDVDGFPLTIRFGKANYDSALAWTVFEIFIGDNLPVDLVVKRHTTPSADSANSKKICVGSSELDEDLHISGKNQQHVLDWAQKGKTLLGLSLLCRLDLGESTLVRGTLRLTIRADLTTEEELVMPIGKLAEIARCLSA